MKNSYGRPLPENAEDFDQLAKSGGLRFTSCYDCGKAFSEENTKTALGWSETQISGACESCFDKIFEEKS